MAQPRGAVDTNVKDVHIIELAPCSALTKKKRQISEATCGRTNTRAWEAQSPCVGPQEQQQQAPGACVRVTESRRRREHTGIYYRWRASVTPAAEISTACDPKGEKKKTRLRKSQPSPPPHPSPPAHLVEGHAPDAHLVESAGQLRRAVLHHIADQGSIITHDTCGGSKGTG